MSDKEREREREAERYNHKHKPRQYKPSLYQSYMDRVTPLLVENNSNNTEEQSQEAQ